MTCSMFSHSVRNRDWSVSSVISMQSSCGLLLILNIL